MKKAIAMVSLALTTWLIAMPVSAQSSDVSRINGNSAIAVWETPEGDIIHDTYIAADKTKAGTDVLVSLCDYNTITFEYSCRQGYLFTTDNVFTTSKLDTASLSPVEVELYDDWGNDAGEVTVQASWTGTGKTQKGSQTFKDRSGDYMVKFSSSSTSRAASFSGSLDGESLVDPAFGLLVQFKSMSMIHFK